MSSKLRARDLPSKRLLGKGLASVGYETELKGERFARLDFIGVPGSTFEKEATVVAGLKHHTNVVKAHGWLVNKTSGSLVLEYVEDDLLGLMQKRKESSSSQPFELAEALDIMLQIARGMNFLHEQNILHGDLKTKNILVTCRKEDDRDALFLVKVADYGLVRTKRKSMSFVSRQARKLDVVRWTAPETLEKVLSEYTDETSSQSDSNSDDECVGASDSVPLSGDVYSFAMTCFQILTGEDPYPNLNWKELGMDIVFGGLRPKLPAASLSRLNILLVSCWSKAPHQRPAFPTICKTLEQILHNLQTPTTSEIQPSPSEDALTLLESGKWFRFGSGNRGVILSRNRKFFNVEIRPQKWSNKNKPCKFWKGSIRTLGLAKYFADTIFYYCGKKRCHFENAPFVFPHLQLLDPTARLLTPAERDRYVQSIAGSNGRAQREEFILKVTEVIDNKDFILQGERYLERLHAPVDEVAPPSSPRDDEECETPLEEDPAAMATVARLASDAHQGAGFELNMGRVFDTDRILESAQQYPECYNISDAPSDEDEGWYRAIEELNEDSDMVDPQLLLSPLVVSTPNAVNTAALELQYLQKTDRRKSHETDHDG